MVLSLPDEKATKALAKAIAPQLRPHDCLTLHGTLGAGKTTFMRHLIQALGHQGEVISPTFMLLQEYPVTLADSTQLPLYHLDAYRIEHPGECEELALPELLQQGILCVEWPQHCGDWLPNDALQLTLTLERSHRQAALTFPKRPEVVERITATFYDLTA